MLVPFKAKLKEMNMYSILGFSIKLGIFWVLVVDFLIYFVCIGGSIFETIPITFALGDNMTCDGCITVYLLFLIVGG